MSRDMNAWKATAGQVENFITQTGLVPVVVQDAVVGELFAHFRMDAAADALYKDLRGEDVTRYIAGRSALVFENNQQFRDRMLAKDPRPQYYAFVRHWMAGLVQMRFPALFDKLPSGFKVGEPLSA